MSAETIPADVLSAAREALAAEFECSVKAFPASPARARRGEMDHTYELKAIVRAILTDRSTRPAETAAPVAEAGDGKVAVSLAHLNIGYLYGIADALERTYPTRAGDIRQCLLQVAKGLSASAATLEAERARAAQAEADLHEVEEQFAKLQEAEAQAEEEACLRVAAEASLSRVLQDRDFWKERFQVESRSRIQAEQRAADALARAEKAEGALEATREDGWRSIAPEDCEVATVQTFGTITLRNSHPAWVRDDDGRTYEAVWTVDDRGRAYWWDIEAESPVDPVAIYPHPLAARASREAQPATDGGDNG